MINYILCVISELIKDTIANDVRDAGIFSIQIDTTQEISVKDQCSFVLRCVNLFSTNIPYMEHHFHEPILAQWCIIFGIINALLH